jgi:hypothetical protein
MQVNCAVHIETTPQVSLLQVIWDSEKAWIVFKDYTPADCKQESKMILLHDQRLFMSVPYISCRDYTDTKGRRLEGIQASEFQRETLTARGIRRNVRFIGIFPLALVR